MKKFKFITISLCAIFLISCGKKEVELTLNQEETYEFITDTASKTAVELMQKEQEKLKLKEEKAKQERQRIAAEEAKKYHFIDVCQDDYEMILDENMTPNPYNVDGLSYGTTDAKGNVLVEGNGLEITETGISLGYKGIISYEDENYTSRFGVDVSRYQGHIDWQKAKEVGVEFAIVRIGFRGYGKSGSIHEDATALTNIKGAKDAGIDVGVYFFSQAINEEESIEEADFIIDKLDGMQLEMPVVFDPEHILHDVARTDDISKEQFTKNCIAFCDRIKKAGYEPMIYANMKWEAYDLDMGLLKDIPFWYADYEKLPQSPYMFEMWQYSQAGHLDGFNGAIDFNVQFIPK